MKIACEKCHEDLNRLVDQQFEKYMVGSVQCPKCRKMQTRYLSEVDLTIYFAASCFMYLIAATIIFTMMNYLKISWWFIAPIPFIFVICYFIQKNLSRSIYAKGFFKKDTMNIRFNEDKSYISKKIKGQYTIFVLVILVLGNGNSDIRLWLGAILIFSIVHIIKINSLIKSEKKKIR